jgi:uncharacterized membrane protein (DUF106 family)
MEDKRWNDINKEKRGDLRKKEKEKGGAARKLSKIKRSRPLSDNFIIIIFFFYWKPINSGS